jgi:inner membrane protein
MNLNKKPGPNILETKLKPPESQIKSQYINKKITTIIGLLLLFSIGLGFVYAITYDRKNRQEDVLASIQSSYGAAQTISTPTFKSPSNSKTEIHPENLEITVTSTHTDKSRGIFKVPVYTANIEMTGNFKATNEFITTELEITVTSTHTDKSRGIFKVPVYTANIEMTGNFKATNEFITTELEITNPKNIINTPTLKIDNSSSQFILQETSINKSQRLNSNPNHNFTINFAIRGTKELLFQNNSNTKNTTLNIDSSWPYPSLQNDIGSNKLNISDNGFQANWEFKGNQLPYKESNIIGYKLYQPNDIYKKTDRSIKYGICVIALVFFSFMMVELLSGVKVNNIQYILVGLSLLIYYTLLLSLGEIIGFNLAYLIASAATISLNTTFIQLLINDSRYSIAIGYLLGTIYILIFALLQTTEYTLLLGSFSAYIIVAASMLASYFINFEKIKIQIKS